MQIQNLQINYINSPNDTAIGEALSIQDELTSEVRENNREMLQRRGFLLSGYSHSDLVDQLKNGGGLYMASDHESVLGYLLHYPWKQFKKYNPQTQTRLISDTESGRDFFEDSDIIYLSQIGVRLGSHGHGVASFLLHQFELDKKGVCVVAAIVKQPLENRRSTAFFSHKGYVEIGELFTPKFGGVNNLASRLFSKKL